MCKKSFFLVCVFAVITACAMLFSCVANMEQALIEQPVPEEVSAPNAYTLVVKAGKGERPDTKALGFDGDTLNASWAVGEQVSVYKADALLGTLSAQTVGKSTTLQGQITGEIAKDDVLTLKFLSPDYASQDGTIAYIAAHCDYAVASVTVTNVEETTVTTSSASFVNQQAICQFTLMQGGNDITASITALTITSGAEMYAITRAAGPSGTDSRSLTLGDLLMVRPAFGEGWFEPLQADKRVDGCRNNAGVWIQVCYHPEHTAEDCPYHKHN